MRSALAKRHMGRVIRAFRLHPHHGQHVISQQTAATWAHITQAQLSRIETQRPITDLDRLTQWARILRVPSLYLWFEVAEPEGETVKRAEFLRMSGGLMAAAAVPIHGADSVASLTLDDCCQWLAWTMWTKRVRSVHESEIPTGVRQFLASYVGTTRTPLGRAVLRDREGSYSFAHPSFVDFYIAQRVFADIARGDGALFAKAQTSHDTDLVIREFVLRNEDSVDTLSRWMLRAPSRVLRVNSAGVLAKLGIPAASDDVVRHLRSDQDSRHLYLTAVASRVLALPWDRAQNLVAHVRSDDGPALAATLPPDQAGHFAGQLADEVHNPRDGAARWCAVVLLNQVRAAAPTISTTALQSALRQEAGSETLRSIAAVLSDKDPISF